MHHMNTKFEFGDDGRTDIFLWLSWRKDAPKSTKIGAKGIEKRPGGKEAEDAYYKADMMIRKYAGRDNEKAKHWLKKKKEASKAMMGESKGRRHTIKEVQK